MLIKWINIALVFLGVLFLAGGATYAFGIIQNFRTEYRKFWVALFILILLFLLGYLLFIFFAVAVEHDHLTMIVSAVFFAAGLFVFLVTLLSFNSMSKFEYLHRLRMEASHDSLTGLLNRRYFEREFEHLLEQSKRSRIKSVLMFVDLNKFKLINDLYGHLAGDQLLQQIAAIFKNRLRKVDLISRYGGDEFLILLYNTSLRRAEVVKEALHKSVNRLKASGYSKATAFGIAIGLTPLSSKTESLDQAIKAADQDCYRDKR